MSRTLLKNDVTLYRKDGSYVNFHIISHIGSGASCVVYHAVSDDNTEHLLKEYYPRHLDIKRDSDGALVIPEHKKNNFDLGLKRFQNANERQKEVRLSKELKNYTSNVQGYFYGNNTEYIDMTVYAGHSYKEIHDESLYVLLRRMKMLTQVVGCYHRNGLLHLDIKPDNIYVRPKSETIEDITLLDFDSVIEECYKLDYSVLSYTRDWAAPEQILPYKRNNICKATDLFAIGEIIFTQIFGRHSTAAERRSFSNYKFDYNSYIFKNINPAVFPLLSELFSHTICNVVEKRYQSAEELLHMLDKIIPLADKEAQFLVSTLPVAKELFIGRDKEIDDIHLRIQENPILFLHGIGGIGKSELAKQYAIKYRKEYDVIIFAPYVTDIISTFVDENYVHISNFCSLKDEKIEKYFLRKLGKIKELTEKNPKRILFIVDNLDTYEDKNINSLFELGCRVLVTSRVDMGSIFKRPQMEVGTFNSVSDLQELFKEYYYFETNELEDVSAIINLVHGHTLTVELIAKQIEAEWSTIREIREKLEHGGLSAIGYEMVNNVKDDIFTQDSTFGHIKTLFDFSLFERQNKENELYVLTNLSLIPFTGIECNIFAEWCELDKHGGKSCVNNLVKSGWIQRFGTVIALHPMVSEVVIKKCTEKNCYSLLKNVSSTIRIQYYNLLNETDISNKNMRLLNGIADKLLASSLKSNVIVEILNNLGILYGGRFDRNYWKTEVAYKYLERALEIGKHMYGDKHINVASLLNNIGVLYNSYNETQKARSCFEETLKIYQENFDNENIVIARTLFNIGVLHKNMNDYESTLKYYKQVFQILKNIYGENSYAVAQQYSWISYLYRHMGLYELSEEEAVKSLNIYRQIKDSEKYVNNVESMLAEIRVLSDDTCSVAVFLPDSCYTDFVVFSDENTINFNNNTYENDIPQFNMDIHFDDSTDYTELIFDEEIDFCD